MEPAIAQWLQDRRSTWGCYLRMAFGRRTVMISNAAHPPRNRGNFRGMPRVCWAWGRPSADSATSRRRRVRPRDAKSEHVHQGQRHDCHMELGALHRTYTRDAFGTG